MLIISTILIGYQNLYMKKFKAAVIGLGVGKAHINSLLKNKYISKIKIFDKNKNKLNKFKKNNHIHKCTNINEIFKDNDVKLICIASYDEFHFEQIKLALKYNKHVFAEKPALTNIKDAKLIRKILKKKKNLYFGSNYILRKSELFIELKKLISKNFFGEVYYVESDYNYGRLNKITNGWRSKDKNYSVNLGGGIHIINLILYLFDSKIHEVQSYSNKKITKSTNFKNDDFVVSILKSKENKIFKISSNFGCVYPHFHKLTLYGGKRTFEHSPLNSIVYYMRNKNRYKKLGFKNKYKSKGEYLNEFISSIVLRKNKSLYLDETFQSLSIAFTIEKSLKSNKPEKVIYI